jgi:hypothetical protein
MDAPRNDREKLEMLKAMREEMVGLCEDPKGSVALARIEAFRPRIVKPGATACAAVTALDAQINALEARLGS